MGEPADPLAEVGDWITAAAEAGVRPAGLLALCTIDRDGAPNVRSVPVRQIDERGLRFHTSLASDKGSEIVAHPDRVAGLLSWRRLGREIRLRGRAGVLDEREADVEFGLRAREDQLWSWVVATPGEVSGRDELESRLVHARARFEGSGVPRPADWRVVRFEPRVIEFLELADDRLHTRRRAERHRAVWSIRALVP